MFRILVASFALLSAPALAQQSAPEIPYDSVPDALKLPPDLNMGEAAGVAVNSKGHIFIAEILNWRVQKLILHPDRAHAAN